MLSKVSGLLFCALLSTALPLGNSAAALASYKDANYKVAIPLLKAALADDAQNPLLHAALLSSFTYEGLLDEAADEADSDETAFPQSPDVLSARGEFAFYLGNMGVAEKLFRAAIKIKDDSPRATFGLSRLLRMASYHRTARILCLRAHEIDPADAYITKSFLNYVPAEKRTALITEFAKAHPWLYRNFDAHMETAKEVDAAINHRQAFELTGALSEVDLRLVEFRYSPTVVRGLGLEVSLNGSQKVRLLLDTGSTGILLTQTLIDKLGLSHLGSSETYGIGDEGVKKSFVSVAESCDIGSLKFKTCIVEALGGKRNISGEYDGLIGADIFERYLIQIDFQRHNLHLKPLPEIAAGSQGHDRERQPDEKGFTPIFQLGHHLLVPTQLNGQDSGLFLIDTGAQRSLVDSAFASQSVKIHRDSYMKIKGVSGEVKNVFEADKAEIQFATFRQRNLGMTAIDLNSAPDHQEVRMAGILGMPVLALFRLTIDYRNGFVMFEPVFH